MHPLNSAHRMEGYNYLEDLAGAVVRWDIWAGLGSRLSLFWHLRPIVQPVQVSSQDLLSLDQ